ncbi:hypothetical protein [Priestia aryabhattai]|nr:hypothetical protein [Priestia aryabhattai]
MNNQSFSPLSEKLMMFHLAAMIKCTWIRAGDVNEPAFRSRFKIYSIHD